MNKAEQTATTAADKSKRTRSPAFPFINLETAIRRAKEFFDKEQQHSANLKVAIKHWNYEEKSSGGLQTAAALVAFGLMKDEGSGEHRTLQVTPLAIRILVPPSAAEQDNAIKEAALAPKIHRQIWEKFGGRLPSDESLRHTLVSEWRPKFNTRAVDGFIKQIRSTVSFAKLSESDNLPAEESSRSVYSPKIGDYVQWESQGVIQLHEPKKVLSISPDGTHAFVEGSSTGLPVQQLSRASAPKPQMAGSVRTQSSPSMNAQEDVYSLPEGRLVVQWPASLSAESVQEVKDYLKLLERKIVRSQAKDAGDENAG